MRIIKLFGDVGSIRTQTLKELESIYDMAFDDYSLIPEDLINYIVKYSIDLNKEIAVYINRKGSILAVCIGDSNKVSLPEVEGRKDISKLSQVRCIHTHPSGNGMLSSVDMSTLEKLRLDAMIAVGCSYDHEKDDYKINNIYVGILNRDAEGVLKDTQLFGPLYPYNIDNNKLINFILEIDKTKVKVFHNVAEKKERAILVGFETYEQSINEDDSLRELAELAKTSGAIVVGSFSQKRIKKDAALFIGKGKAEELSMARQTLNADLIIFDDELSGANIRNLEDVIGARVIDRTTLILDIFASRARTNEGKLQVELAQLKYLLPRLTGRGIQLSRLGGGIGTRGPGETQLETDRRHINRKIKYIERQLALTGKRRNELREARQKNRIPVASLAGYTNSGKSTILNKLCEADVMAEDMLFATLDTTTRRIKDFKEYGREALLIDTVGFIRKLPHALVEAFKSTLEETIFADLIVHVVDGSSPAYEDHIKIVDEILNEIGAGAIPRLLVFNKIDLLDESQRNKLSETVKREDKVFFISAATGQGLEALSDAIFEELSSGKVVKDLLLPFSEGSLLSYLHDNAKVDSVEYVEDGVLVRATMSVEVEKYFSNYELPSKGIIDNEEL